MPTRLAPAQPLPDPRAANGLSLRGLEAFRAVLETGSASAAARLLGISQPAISRLLKQLEDDLAVALFVRARGRLIPTPEAERLKGDVVATLAGLDRIRRGAGEARKMGEATLRLGVTPMLYECVVLPVMPRLLERHPDLLLTLEIGISDSVSDWLLREQVELGLASLLDSHPGIEASPLVSTHSVCVLPRAHPLAALHRVGPEDLAPYELVTMTRRFSSRHRIEQLFRKAGVPLRLRVETNVAGTILDMVRAGSGVAILNGLSWIPRMDTDLIALPFHPILHHRYGFLHVADRGLSAVARDLTALVRHHARATLADAYVDHRD